MKNSRFNSNTSHLNLFPQSDCLFSFDNVSSAAIRNYGGHAQRTITMSRIFSHSATAWDNYIAAFLTVTNFRGDACERFFCLLPVGVCIDAFVTIRSYVLCVSTH